MLFHNSLLFAPSTLIHSFVSSFTLLHSLQTQTVIEATYFWIEHRALGRYSQMALYFYERVYDDSFSTTCWTNNHCTVTRRHRLIQLNDFVLLIFLLLLFSVVRWFVCQCVLYRLGFCEQRHFTSYGFVTWNENMVEERERKKRRIKKKFKMRRKKVKNLFLYLFVNYLNMRMNEKHN